MHKVKRFEIQIPRNIKVFMSKKTKGLQQQSTGMSIYIIYFFFQNVWKTAKLIKFEIIYQVGYKEHTGFPVPSIHCHSKFDGKS